MQKMNHKQSERIHTQGRAQERFGIQWSKRIRKSVMEQIHSGKAELIDRRANEALERFYGPVRKRQLRYIVVIDGREIVAAYDPKENEIATLLPLEWCGDKWAVERRLLLNKLQQQETQILLDDLKRQAKEIAESSG